jgi:hypothetical protein
MDTKEQQYFWMGFDIAMAGHLVNTDSEWVAEGWAWGAREYAGLNYATTWQGRRIRFRYAILKLRWQLKGKIRRMIRQMKMQCGILIDEPF